jgi:hypothetical protein
MKVKGKIRTKIKAKAIPTAKMLEGDVCGDGMGSLQLPSLSLSRAGRTVQK